MTSAPLHVLVTGVGGFIGAHVARRLIKDGHSVVGVDDFSNGRRENVPHGLELIVCDLADDGSLKSLPKKCDVILHLAGQSSGEISFDDPVADLNKNTISTLNLIRYGMDAGAHRFVHASSMSVYGDVIDHPVTEDTVCRPLSCYGTGKLAAERYVEIYGHKLPYVIFRMFNVYGPGQDMRNLRQGMISIFLAQALKNGDVQVKGSLDRFRDFIYIDDVVAAWRKVTTSSQADGQILNLGTGHRTSVQELLESMKKQIPEMTWFNQGITPGDQLGIYADTTCLQSLLENRTFVNLDDGLANFMSWARNL